MDVEPTQKQETAEFLGQIDFLSQFSSVDSFGSSQFNLVLPGDKITSDSGYIQGKGTYEENGAIYSSLIGYVKQTDKLVSVMPLKSRYTCKSGDIVIGRVTEIVNKKWKVDINSSDTASLHLNAVKLQEVQRRKTEEDEKQMRLMLKEGELVCAEVQSVNNDGTISLHIRSNKFGKLSNGVLVEVEHSLIKQHAKHIVDFSFGVKLILAMNGKIWIEPKDLTETAIEQIARLKIILQVLNENFVAFRIESILELYNATLNIGVQAINSQDTRRFILEQVAKSINKQNIQDIAEIIKGEDGDTNLLKPSMMEEYARGGQQEDEEY